VDLALKMDIDPKAFVATIEKYNKYCEQGKDPDFGKKAEYLKPVKKPPFYAFWGQRFTEVTHGGIAVNEDGEMLDTKGKVIPGLYAGGDCTTIYGSGNSKQGGGEPARQGGAPGSQDGRQGGPPAGGQGGARGGPGSSPGPFGSGRGRIGGGLGGAITFGYSTGIKIAKYLD
jgi:hypothetical protein